MLKILVKNTQLHIALTGLNCCLGLLLATSLLHIIVAYCVVVFPALTVELPVTSEVSHGICVD